jgi:hypothetical protein
MVDLTVILQWLRLQSPICYNIIVPGTSVDGIMLEVYLSCLYE